MKAFVLHIPIKEESLAQKVARDEGIVLMKSENASWVLLSAEVPEGLKKYLMLPGDGSKNSASAKKTSSTKVALEVPFEHRNVAAQSGAKWDAAKKMWYYQGEESLLPPILESLRAPKFSWSWALVHQAQPEGQKGFKGEAPMKPKAHQIEAAEAIWSAYDKRMPGFLLADEVGLGKTLSAWLGIQNIIEKAKLKSILVVCPLSVQAHWRETIEKMGSATGQIVILNYEKLDRLVSVDDGVKVKSKKGLARRGSAAQVDCIIFDESHKLKNENTARSKLAHKLIKNATFCLWLSATAGQSPLELSYLAKLLSKIQGKGISDYEAWCQAQGFKIKKGAFGALEWDDNPQDSKKLAQLLYGSKPTVALRRRPQEIAGWPELSRILYPQELTVQERLLYEQEWGLFKKALKSPQILQTKTGTKGVKKSLGALVEALRFRQKSSLIRVEKTVEFALDLLESGVKAAISCAFFETLEKMRSLLEAKKIKVALIHGQQSAQEREAERLLFQKGGAQVILFTIEEGISLHQNEYENVPRALLIHDLRWSGIQMAQIEGRTHRNGEFSQAYWLVGEQTIEYKIGKRVSEKMTHLKVLSGEYENDIEENLWQILLDSENV